MTVESAAWPRPYQSLRYGHFTHLVPGLTVASDGAVVADIDALAAGFDVERYADDIASFGVDHVIFTAWHRAMVPLYPSPVMERWRGSGRSARRDLIGELLEHLRQRRIAGVLYTHPRDGHDFDADDQSRTGWGAVPAGEGPDPDLTLFDKDRWNDFVCEAYAELVERYGDQLSGLYLDEGSERGDSERVVDYDRLRRVVLDRAPHLWLVQNWYGNQYTADSSDKEYYRWQEFESADGGSWPAYVDLSVSSVNASIWWASRSSDADVALFADHDLLRYTVLQISANRTGGALRWAAGPYADGGWERGYADQMSRLGCSLAAVAPSLLLARASSWLPTPPGATFDNLEWGVATESQDGRQTFLHVLKPPDGPALHVAWVDAATVTRAFLLPDELPIPFSVGPEGMTLTHPASTGWDPVHTVICLEHPAG